MDTIWPPSGTQPLPIDVVSVQSQVVYGRVGNNVALPTLTGFGLTAAALPTVLLSNTPHYPTLHGGAVPADWFGGWLDDLAARGGLRQLRGVLTGYLGGPEQADVLARWMRARRAELPNLRVVIDPVIGDHDQGVYVDPALVEVIRAQLLPLADVLTPNDFELAHLTGADTHDLASTVAAARKLLTGRTRWVAVTSASPATWPENAMQLVLVTYDRAFVITHARIEAEPKGTGDLFAANLIGYWLRGAGAALPDAAVRACRRVVEALRATRRARCAELLLPDAPDASDGDEDVLLRELQGY